MTDLHAELTETESGLSSDLDAIAAKLDSADANTLTQADVDAVAALKAKADALITAAPVEPTDAGTAVPDSTTDTTTEDDTATA